MTRQRQTNIHIDLCSFISSSDMKDKYHDNSVALIWQYTRYMTEVAQCVTRIRADDFYVNIF